MRLNFAYPQVSERDVHRVRVSVRVDLKEVVLVTIVKRWTRVGALEDRADRVQSGGFVVHVPHLDLSCMIVEPILPVGRYEGSGDAALPTGPRPARSFYAIDYSPYIHIRSVIPD